MSRLIWIRQAATFAVAGLATACALAPSQEPAQPAEPPVVQVDADGSSALEEANERIVALELANRTLRKELAALELRLIDNSTQLTQTRERFQRLSRAHEDAVSEVVRSQAKLQGNVSQADAAANIAEAELALSERASGDEVVQARALLASASLQFDQGNYGGALYLSNQSKRVLASARPASQMLAAYEGENRFSEMLAMWVSGNSNLRAGPGLEHSVVQILKAGTPLRGYSYADAWVRVVLEDGSDGWVYRTLVSQSPPQPPSD